MKKILFVCFWLVTFPALAQHQLHLVIKDSSTNEVLPGSIGKIQGTANGASADAKGELLLNNIPSGAITLEISLLGYQNKSVRFVFPLQDSLQMLTILLQPEGRELNEVIVSTMRTNSRIDDLPTKIEVLGQEEMDEESVIVPGNISSILGDLSIITIQRTSQVNGNEAIRMQGLDAKYTQIMRDGLPLYGGFSGSLGVLSIPPLDLKQVEIIKGSASTLYGGGAIGGLINFISKTPADSNYTTLTLNATSLGEGNFNCFASAKKNKLGFTLFGGANVKQAADINRDGFTEVPFDQSYTLHPRLFFQINPSTELHIGVSSNYDNRKGGDYFAVQHGLNDTAHTYLQTEKTWRHSADINFSKQFSKNNTLSAKIAASAFQRTLTTPGFEFNGTQFSSYNELNDAFTFKKHSLVAGLNLVNETFQLGQSDSISFKNYSYTTGGIFFQDDWQVLKKLSFQLGLRYDHNNTFGDFVLPRISLFYKPCTKLSIRLAAGSGYKTPNMFDLTDPNAQLQPLPANIKSEKSYGANADINYHTVLFGKINISLDQAFYYTNILHPLILGSDTTGHSLAQNGNYLVNSYGTDTYLRFVIQDVELYLGYNHTESIQQYDTANVNMPFNPKDKCSATLAYEIENKWRMGIEASHTANQYIFSNKKVPNFLFMALMVERKFKFGSLVLNCENLLDERQSDYERLVTGSKHLPIFKPVWAPIEGRVINASLKINL